MAIKLGIVGIGFIARQQHLPVIATSPDFELVAAASRNAKVDGVKTYANIAEMLAGNPEIEAVSLCAPPVPRSAEAQFALREGKHVLLEKPPGATLSDVQALAELAATQNITLNASWHSRHAPGVAPARGWLERRTLRSVRVIWKEDVRVWHPGQEWIFEPGGLGIFDPTINALSILTAILPAPFSLRAAKLAFPENRQAPIAGELAFTDTNGASITASVDFLQTGPQTWDIVIQTETGELTLSKGGSELYLNGARQPLAHHEDVLRGEYHGVYAHFAALIKAGKSDVDVSPLRHAADAFMLGERITAPPFSF